MAKHKWFAREVLSERQAVEGHDPGCTWPRGEPCLRFSTDGTRAGAEIAHTMGTTSELVIAQGKAPNDVIPPPFVSDVAAEQADWDGEPGPPVDHERPRMYPTKDLSWGVYPEDELD
jgi:hypothetical protein